MATDDVTISNNDLDLLTSRQSKIENVFSVRVTTSVVAASSTSAGTTWVTLNGARKENCKTAKAYIVALCNPRCRYRLDHAVKAAVLEALERDYQVAVVASSSGDVTLQGDDEQVATALSYMETIIHPGMAPSNELDLGCSSKHDHSQGPTVSDNARLMPFEVRTDTERATIEEIYVIAQTRGFSKTDVDRLDEQLDVTVLSTEQLIEKLRILSRKRSPSPTRRPTQPPPAVRPAAPGRRLRYIVVDGSNVAMTHGNGNEFSSKGIGIVVDYFRQRGHWPNLITVFVPSFRKSPRSSKDPKILERLHEQGVVRYTPSWNDVINGKRRVCYDDRWVVDLATREDGIIVSNDNYRDLAEENPEYVNIIRTRVLRFTMVADHFMPAPDPTGERGGPTLDEFLAYS